MTKVFWTFFVGLALVCLTVQVCHLSDKVSAQEREIVAFTNAVMELQVPFLIHDDVLVHHENRLNQCNENWKTVGKANK